MRAGVDHQAGAVAQHQAAVEVELRLPPHEDAVGDLLPAGRHQQIRIGRPRLSVAPSPTHSPCPSASRRADQAAAQASSASIAGTRGGASASASTTSITGAERAQALGQPARADLAVAHAGVERAEREFRVHLDHAVGRRVTERVVQRPDGRDQVPGLHRERALPDAARDTSHAFA